MTTCNEFVGRFGTQLGSTKYIGRFDIEAELTRMSKGQAWVNVITVRWSALGTVEKFLKAPVVTEQMGGTWNDKEPLPAVKM
jgi:hypothetical protein